MIVRAVIGVFAAVGLLFALPAKTLGPGDRVENFRLLDHRGESHELYYYSDASAVAIMVHGNGCPIVRNALPRLKEIRAAYAGKGVKFLLINSNLQDDRDEIAAEAEQFGIDFPILNDKSQLIGESLGFVRTAEMFVIDPQDRWKLKYRGPINDRIHYETQRPEADNRYLTSALNAVLAGEPVEKPRVDGPGCLINFPERQRQDEHEEISYSEEIAPLLVDHCAQCHRPDGIGPWAMSDYNQIRGFAPMIREVVRTGRMPPWQADPHYGEFSNDISLTIEEKRKLVHWIEAGSPRGEGPDPLPAAMDKDWPDWPLGEPDAIVQVPGFKVPPTGLIPYLHVVVENPLDKPVWVRAMSFLPESREVVHHIIAAYTDEPPSQVLARGSYGTVFGAYAPGIGPIVYPEGTGMPLKPDAKFILQLHYTTIGRTVRDATQMGLYFHGEPPRHEHRTVILENRDIRIPPRVKRHTDLGRKTFERDIVVYSLIPHAHYRGRSSGFKAIYPDGHEEILLSVPNYDFNWQHVYELVEPKHLPAGTTIVYTTTWDNSAQNRANPDPDKEVIWGFQSQDEMLFGVINYRYAD
jgi:mono/diheme cytochrome c family protein/peroxiredoxin